MSGWRVQKIYSLDSRSVGFDRRTDRLNAMQEPLRELRCANYANVANFCTLNSTGAQFALFEGLGTNSRSPFLIVTEPSFPLLRFAFGAFGGTIRNRNSFHALFFC